MMKTLDDLLKIVRVWRLKSNRIVFTNGCFDLLHNGHIYILEEAKKRGDKLIVGVNSDDSVKRLKGETRPILNQQERMQVLEALTCVDAVIVFEEDTPINLIKAIQPDVLIKGGDWSLDKIVGHEFVQSYNGVVESIPFVDQQSTSRIINKIIKNA